MARAVRAQASPNGARISDITPSLRCSFLGSGCRIPPRIAGYVPGGAGAAAQKCEAMTAEVHSAIAFMRDTAASYREEAKKIFKRIEECSIFTEEVRKTCETVKLRMIGGK